MSTSSVLPESRSAKGSRAGLLTDRVVLTLLALVLFLAFKLHQYAAFGVHGELADFESMLWSVVHGGPLQKSPDAAPFFSQHVSPVLYALVPVYALAGSPYTLLVVQAVAAALAIVPLHILAASLLPGRVVAACVSVAFLLYRQFHYGVLYDFHMEILYPLLYFSLFAAFEKRRWVPFYLFLLLTVCVKEDANLANLGLGLYLILRREPRHGLATLGFSAVSLLLAVGVIIPHFREGLPDSYQFTHYWSGYGATRAEIVRAMLNPLRHLEVIFTGYKVGKMLTLFSGLLFLPLLSWRAALCLVLPGWFILYSSDNRLMNALLIYYGLLVIPFLFYSALITIRSLGARWPRKSGRIVPAVSALLLLTVLGNSRVFKLMNPEEWRIDPRYRAAEEMIDRLPRTAPVAAQVDLQSHVPAREWRELIPRGIPRAEYLLFDTAGSSWPLSRDENLALVDSLRAASGWTVLDDREGFVLLQRAETGHESGLQD
ncbi:MAG: DUF2079 domain-containing protein [Candidatus Eisenbacteria bacterium]